LEPIDLGGPGITVNEYLLRGEREAVQGHPGVHLQPKQGVWAASMAFGKLKKKC